MKISLLANGNTEPLLLEDAHDVVSFLEATGRTVPRHKWADESIAAAQAQALEGMF